MAKANKKLMTLYTDAPRAYDGFSTKEVDVVGISINGNGVRKITLQIRDFDWQTTRYASGSYRVAQVGPYGGGENEVRVTVDQLVNLNDWCVDPGKL